MRNVTCTLLVLAVAVGPAILIDAAQSAEPKKTVRLFELRKYTTHPSKLDDLNKRFREHTNALFEKHGMTLIGFWTPVEGPEAENTLIYILAFPDREARDKAFAAFRNDPVWKKAFGESRRDGPIVQKVESTFITPTDYSPIR